MPQETGALRIAQVLEKPQVGSNILLPFFCKPEKSAAGQDTKSKNPDSWLSIGGERSPSGFVPSGAYLGQAAAGGLLLAPGSEK